MFKVILIGSSGVGKSCLLLRFADDEFSDNFIATIGVDFRFKTIEVNGKMIKFQIWDTAGQERFRTITSAYYRGADGIVIVYDQGYRPSFDALDEWMLEIEKHAHPEVAKMIIGNKSDLGKKEVEPAEGEAYATKHKLPFIQTSAKEDYHITNAFAIMAEKLMQKKLFDQTKLAEVDSSLNVRKISNPKMGEPACCGH